MPSYLQGRAAAMWRGSGDMQEEVGGHPSSRTAGYVLTVA